MSTILWATTALLNVILAVILYVRNHHTRYPILFSALLWAIFASPVLHLIYSTYGTNSSAYDLAFRLNKSAIILFAFAIIFEGWRWRNSCVRLPQEIYLAALIATFVAQRGQFLQVSYVIYEALRYANLAATLWLIFCFRKESPYERKRFRHQRSHQS